MKNVDVIFEALEHPSTWAIITIVIIITKIMMY